MKLYIIAARNPLEPDEPWVESAWDEYAVDDNPSGYEEAVRKARIMHGPDHVGVGIIHVSDGFLGKLFKAREEKASKEEVVSVD